jgi:hypothetical protein
MPSYTGMQRRIGRMQGERVASQRAEQDFARQQRQTAIDTQQEMAQYTPEQYEMDVQEGTFDLIDTLDQNPHMTPEEAAGFYNQKGGHQLREVIKNPDGSLTLVDKFRRRNTLPASKLNVLKQYRAKLGEEGRREERGVRLEEEAYQRGLPREQARYGLGQEREEKRYRKGVERGKEAYGTAKERAKEEAIIKSKKDIQNAMLKNPKIRPYQEGQEISDYEVVQILGDGEKYVIPDNDKIKLAESLRKEKKADQEKKLKRYDTYKKNFTDAQSNLDKYISSTDSQIMSINQRIDSLNQRVSKEKDADKKATLKQSVKDLTNRKKAINVARKSQEEVVSMFKSDLDEILSETEIKVEPTPAPQGTPYRKGTTPPEAKVDKKSKRKGKKAKKAEKQDWDKIIKEAKAPSRRIQDVNRITVDDVVKGQGKKTAKNKAHDLIIKGARSTEAKDGSTLYTSPTGERLLVVDKDGMVEWEATK